MQIIDGIRISSEIKQELAIQVIERKAQGKKYPTLPLFL